jgi:hypothetical protein
VILAEELQKRMKDGIFVITGTQKPSSNVSYLGTKPITVTRDGAQAGAIAMYFELTARVKLDAGTGPFTRKLAAVQTNQLVRILIVPHIDGGALSAIATAEICQVTASKDRLAKQKDADDFAQKLEAALAARLSAVVPNCDLIPDAMKKVRVISSLEISDKDVNVQLGSAGTGYARDSAADAAKKAPPLK